MKPPSFQAVAGALLILGGSVVMLAWSAQAPWLARLAPNGAVMVFNTALCFFLAGVALTLASTRLDFGGSLRTFLVCAMGLLAMLTLAEHLFAIDLRVDWAQLHRWLPDKNPHPGRMGPNTALAFLLIAATLIPRAPRGRANPDILGHMLPAAVIAWVKPASQTTRFSSTWPMRGLASSVGRAGAIVASYVAPAVRRHL